MSPITSPALSTPLAGEPSAERLPIAGLLALAMTGFIAILTETLPAGLLPRISADLRVSDALAGQLVTLYALGSLLASIPLTAATQGVRRRPLLLAAILGFLVFNTVTALSTNYALTLGARAFAGVAAGLSWGILTGYARRMVTPALQGRALAIAMVGTPLALSLGVPLGAFFGGIIGWRALFWGMSALAMALIGWVCWKVPDFPGQSAEKRMSVRAVFLAPGVRPVLFVIFAWMLAHNILYTYIAPFLVLSGLSQRVDLVLLSFGVAALLGIWGVGVWVDRWLRPLVMVSLGAFALVAVALTVGGGLPWVVYPAVALWGLTFGGAATLLQTASSDAAGEGVDLAQAMVTTSWNCAIAGGGIFGGVLLERFGPASFPPVLFLIVLVAMAAAWRAKTHGFSPGTRHSSR